LTVVITGGDSDEVSDNNKGMRMALTVCSSTTDNALPGWRDRIHRMKCPEIPGHLPIAELSEGTPEVFRHLITAAHHYSANGEPFMVEDELSLKQVRDIAIPSHQYQAIQLIAGNVPGWVEAHIPSGWELDDTPDTYLD
jgi:hypothetical protein